MRTVRFAGTPTEIEQEEGYTAEEFVHSLAGARVPRRGGRGGGNGKRGGGSKVRNEKPQQPRVEVPKIYYLMLLVSLLVAGAVIWQVWKDSQGTRETVQNARDVKTAVEKTVEAVLGRKTVGTVVPTKETSWVPPAEEIEELPEPEEAEAEDYLQVVKKEVWSTIWVANEDKIWQTPVILTRQGAASHIEWYKARELQEPLDLIEAVLSLSELLNATPRDWETAAKAAAKAEEVGQFSEEEKKTGPVELVRRLYETQMAMAAPPTPIVTSWVPPTKAAAPGWTPPAPEATEPAPAPAATPMPTPNALETAWIGACGAVGLDPYGEKGIALREECLPADNIFNCLWGLLTTPTPRPALAEDSFTVDGNQAGYFTAYTTVYSVLIAEGRKEAEVEKEEVDEILEYARAEGLDVRGATRQWEQTRRRIVVKNAAVATADRVKDFLRWAKQGGDNIDVWGQERGLWGWEENPTPRSTLVLGITNPTTSTRRPTATPVPTANPITNPLVWTGTGWATTTPAPPPTVYLPMPTQGWSTATPTPVPLGFSITSGTPSPTPPWGYELSPSPTPTPLGW